MVPTWKNKVLIKLHSALLICGMAGVAWLCTTKIWDLESGFWVLLAVGLLLLLSPSLPKVIILLLSYARQIGFANFPEGVSIVEAFGRLDPSSCSNLEDSLP